MNALDALSIFRRPRLQAIRGYVHCDERQEFFVSKFRKVLAKICLRAGRITVNRLTILATKVADIQEQLHLIVLGKQRIQGVLCNQRLADFGNALLESLREVNELDQSLRDRRHSCAGSFKIDAVMPGERRIFDRQQYGLPLLGQVGEFQLRPKALPGFGNQGWRRAPGGPHFVGVIAGSDNQGKCNST